MVWYLNPKHLNYSFINKNVVSLTALQIAANGDGGANLNYISKVKNLQKKCKYDPRDHEINIFWCDKDILWIMKWVGIMI